MIKGLNYDVGIVFGEYQSNFGVDEKLLRKEMQIIKNDLHVEAIRLSGTAVEDLIAAAEIVLDEGLDVWLSPHYIDADLEYILNTTVRCAAEFEKLRVAHPERDCVFITGCEFSCFANGLGEQPTFMQRITAGEQFTIGKTEAFKKFTNDIAIACKKVFNGKLTYACQFWEEADWTNYDIRGIDYYRDDMTRPCYEDTLKGIIALGKPVANLEFGYCCFKGCRTMGAGGFLIVDQSDPSNMKLNKIYERAEDEQAEEILESHKIHERIGMDAEFVFTFKHSGYPHRENDPLHDMDLASFGLVKCYENKFGTVYPDMKWEPKEAFYTVAEFNK